MERKFKRTPAGEIPVDWDSVSIGDPRVVQVIKAGGTPHTQTPEYWENGTIPFVKIEDITKCNKHLETTITKITPQGLENSSAWLVPANSLLLSMYGSYGEVAINRVPVATNQAIIAIQVKNSVADLEFFYYCLTALHSRWHRQAQETTQKNLSAGIIRSLFIPLPPINEQKKIAEILSAVDAAIDKAAAVVTKTKELKKGLMRLLLIRGIGHKKFKITKLGRIPEAWDLKTCEDLCDLITVGIVIQPAQLYVDSGVPCLRSLNILEDSISDDQMVFISSEANEAHSKSKLREGDVVAVRTGYPGTSCVVPNKYDGANCVDLVVMRPSKGLAGTFLSRFINSPEGRRQVLKGQGGLAQQHFNVGEVCKMLIPVPSLDEQQEISDALFAMDAVINKEAGIEKDLESLKKGLMITLLAGKIRVPVSAGVLRWRL